MNITDPPRMLILTISTLIIFLAGCETFEVGLEPISTPSPTVLVEPPETGTDFLPPTLVIPPTENSSPPTQDSSPTESSPPQPTSPPNVPQLVSIGHLTPFASPDIGVLTLKDGQLSVEPSPVYYQLFWDYDPTSGRLAFSPEFFHASESNNVSVTSLWVYDYQSGRSEKWLDDNVARVSWAPGGERLTASIYNPETGHIDLVFVSGPDQIESIAECASTLYSWSPQGDILAYVNAVSWVGGTETCAGTYLVSFPNGFAAPERDLLRVSDFGRQELLSGHQADKPIWALEYNALIFPDQPFWVVPLDGTPAFVPRPTSGEEPINLPRPFGSLWSGELRQLIGTVDAGLSGAGGVWIYQLSQDLNQIDKYFRLGDLPQGDNSFITLVDWWNPGESVLVLDGDTTNADQYLSEFWKAPRIWSLTADQWVDEFNQ